MNPAPRRAPAQPVITDRCNWVAQKNTRERVVLIVEVRDANPGNGFCRCPRSIAQQRDTNQPQQFPMLPFCPFPALCGLHQHLSGKIGTITPPSSTTPPAGYRFYTGKGTLVSAGNIHRAPSAPLVIDYLAASRLAMASTAPCGSWSNSAWTSFGLVMRSSTIKLIILKS